MSALVSAFEESFDHETVARYHCRPVVVLLVLLAAAAIAVTSRYVPAIHAVIGLADAFVPVGLTAAAAAFSLATWRVHPRRRAVAVLQLFDTALYGAALFSLAVLSEPPASFVFAGFWVIAAMHWATVYHFSLVGTLAFAAGPTAVLVAAGGWIEGVALALGLTLFIYISLVTRDRHRHDRRRLRTERAIRELDRLFAGHREQNGAGMLDRAVSVVHRAKNELSPAKWNIDYIRERLGDDDLQRTIADVSGSIETTYLTLHEFLLDQRRRGRGEETVFAPDVVEDVEDALAQQPRGKARVTFEAFPEIFLAAGEDMLQMCLITLIANSVEAGAREVRVCAEERPAGMLTIRVCDDGGGLPESVRARLFEPFNTAGKRDGVGLGLYLCARLAEACSGAISLASTGDEGTVFEIVCPRSGERALFDGRHGALRAEKRKAGGD